MPVNSPSVYPPQEKNPEVEVHEEIGFFSFDEAIGKLVLREFHVEGFVNQYVVESWDAESRTLAIVTESLRTSSRGGVPEPPTKSSMRMNSGRPSSCPGPARNGYAT